MTQEQMMVDCSQCASGNVDGALFTVVCARSGIDMTDISPIAECEFYVDVDECDIVDGEYVKR